MAQEAKTAPGAGHNSGADPTAADRLRNIIERVERLEEEKRALSSDIKDIMAEAKSAGFDTKIIRRLIKRRKQDSAKAEEEDTLFDTYGIALGMWSRISPATLPMAPATSPIADMIPPMAPKGSCR